MRKKHRSTFSRNKTSFKIKPLQRFRFLDIFSFRSRDIRFLKICKLTGCDVIHSKYTNTFVANNEYL